MIEGHLLKETTVINKIVSDFLDTLYTLFNITNRKLPTPDGPEKTKAICICSLGFDWGFRF